MSPMELGELCEPLCEMALRVMGVTTGKNSSGKLNGAWSGDKSIYTVVMDTECYFGRKAVKSKSKLLKSHVS